MADAPAELDPPSAWFTAHDAALRATAAIGPVLDVACGRGRHALAAARLGLDVLAIDRNEAAIAELARAEAAPGRLDPRCLDLETEPPPTLPARAFGAVLVFRYLHRPLAPWISERLAPGGLLLYETFTTRQRSLGWGPSRDAFLLEPGELPTLFPDLEIDAYEEGPTPDPRPAQTARLVAHRAR